jgi:hypothetical protein
MKTTIQIPDSLHKEARVSHPRIYAPPTPLEKAIDQVEAWLESPSLVLISESEDYWFELRSLLQAGRSFLDSSSYLDRRNNSSPFQSQADSISEGMVRRSKCPSKKRAPSHFIGPQVQEKITLAKFSTNYFLKAAFNSFRASIHFFLSTFRETVL